MAKTLEKIAEEIFKECEADGEPVTMEEALEMAKMETNSKEITNYTQATVEKKPKKAKERKVDDEKLHLLGCIKTLLEGMQAEILSVKNEVELEFNYGGNHYSVKLVKHRPPKA